MSGKDQKGIWGGTWTSYIYFDPEADNRTGDDYFINDVELKTKLRSLVANERISKISVYKCKLTTFQLTKFIWFHAFVVFETNGWWWSIEKTQEGLTIQRSRILKYVKTMHRGKPRIGGIVWGDGLTLIAEDTSNYVVWNLFDWLWTSDQLNKDYNLVEENCKNFAREVFNQVSKKKLVTQAFGFLE